MINWQSNRSITFEVNAIKLNIENFTWSSGIKSPIYCDNRLILSYQLKLSEKFQNS